MSVATIFLIAKINLSASTPCTQVRIGTNIGTNRAKDMPTTQHNPKLALLEKLKKIDFWIVNYTALRFGHTNVDFAILTFSYSYANKFVIGRSFAMHIFNI